MGKYQAMVALAMPQELDEHIRPLRLFHETAGERAKEIDGPQRRLARKADAFETYGMQSLFASEALGGARESSKTLPSEMRQRIVDLPFEHPAMSWREIAEMCSSRYARRPDHTSVQHIATSGPPPTRKARRYQSWHEISDPAVRKLAAVRLHAEGWSITSIAKYVQCTRHTVYDTLERWTQEGVAGLDAKPSGRKVTRKIRARDRQAARESEARENIAFTRRF